MIKYGLFVKLEARPGKEDELEKVLRSALTFVEQEPGTASWFALRLGPSTFAIFDVFQDEAGREAHLSGRVAEALFAKASELLLKEPTIQKFDVLAAKTQESRVEAGTA